MGMSIEQARAALGLRKRLDAVDLELAAEPSGNPPTLALRYSNNSVAHARLAAREVDAVMAARRDRLRSERLLILAEAAEQGFTIEDAPAIVSEEIKAS